MEDDVRNLGAPEGPRTGHVGMCTMRLALPLAFRHCRQTERP